LYRFDGLSGFRLAETGEILISTVRGRSGPEVTSPFASFTPIWYWLGVEIFRLSPIVEKLFDFLDYH
jgi:hypothetical protein